MVIYGFLGPSWVLIILAPRNSGTQQHQWDKSNFHATLITLGHVRYIRSIYIPRKLKKQQLSPR